MYSYIKKGVLESSGSSITEGIGQGRVTGNIAGAPIDDAYQIPDAEMLPIVFSLLKRRGALRRRLVRHQRGRRDPAGAASSAPVTRS